MAIKDKLQNLLNKVTGKTVEGSNIEEVINDATNKYEGGNSGSGTGSVFTGYDLAKAIDGKHISVDALIELLKKHDVDLTINSSFYFNCVDCNNDIVDACSLTLDSSTYFSIIGDSVSVSEGNNIEDTLLTYKQEIEALTVDLYGDGKEWTSIYYLTIYNSYTTAQVALSDFAAIFVD